LTEVRILTIEDVLYTLPGYKEAEKTDNRDEQVRIINKLIKEEKKLQDFFFERGLQGLMVNLFDPSGRLGLMKNKSPKALLEFYSRRKGLDWFDRSRDTYVQAWRITQYDQWKRGEESAQLGVEAIEDVLYTLPGYKEAEKTGDRKNQIRALNKIIKIKGGLTKFFNDNGLCGMMGNLFDPTGRLGLMKNKSPKALLEFYSRRKGLDWFNKTKHPHIDSYGNGKLKVVYKKAA
jgi:hypothetical protein